jgi:hypothetical protein
MHTSVMTGPHKVEIRAMLLVLAFSSLGSAAGLKPETLDAWRDYMQVAKERLQASVHARNLFLQADEFSGMSARLQRGEVIVAPAAGETPKRVPYGLIHDWMASAFVPGVRVGDVLRVLRNYGEYKEFYKPTVIESRELGGSKDGDDFSLIFTNRSLLSHTAIESDYQVAYTKLDAKRWYSVAYTTRIEEIENYGKPDENKLDVGMGTGYIWRMNTIERFEERDGGVYIEIEAIALSRDVPGSLRWMIDPLIRRVAKSTFTAYMGTTRDAVLDRRFSEGDARTAFRK